jgi:hypothetical protein
MFVKETTVQGSYSNIVIHPLSSIYAALNSTEVQVFDGHGQALQTLKNGKTPFVCQWNPKLKVLATSYTDGMVL